MPKVIVPETKKETYKAKRVELLNDDPKISRDRLERVRQRNEYFTKRGEHEVADDDSPKVCLYSDFAFLDRIRTTYRIGRVERMVYQNGKKKFDYKHLEPFNSSDKDNLSVIMSVYSEHDNGVFDSEKLTIRTIPFNDLFCEVNLSLIDVQLS